MTRQIIYRVASLGVLAAGLLFATATVQASSQTSSGGCGRACLRQMLDTYLTAVFRHDPNTARLSDDHYATENTAVVHNGEGFWNEFTGYGDVQRRYFDPYTENAAYFGLLKQDGHDVTVSVRIAVAGDRVSEAEWIISAAGPGMGDVQRVIKFPPPEGPMPASERSSRFILISIANDYFQATKDHDGSWIPADPGCKQKVGPIMSHPRRADICHDNFESLRRIVKDVVQRRFPVVDEEMGVVLGVGIFTRYPGVDRLANLPHQYFRVRDGKIVDIWTSVYSLPMQSPLTSGWEDR